MEHSFFRPAEFLFYGVILMAVTGSAYALRRPWRALSADERLRLRHATESLALLEVGALTLGVFLQPWINTVVDPHEPTYVPIMMSGLILVTILLESLRQLRLARWGVSLAYRWSHARSACYWIAGYVVVGILLQLGPWR
jgi:hypothetical protein